MFTYFLWIRSVKTGSVFWSSCTALSYFYMVRARLHTTDPMSSLLIAGVRMGWLCFYH